MEGLRQYIVSVTAAAIVCGIIMSLLPKSDIHGMIKMLCGLFLAFTVIDPLTKIDLDKMLSEMTISYTAEADAAVAFGEELSDASMREFIKAETEAYILDKANAYHVTLDADVTLSDGEAPVPVSVVLWGRISPYARQQLSQILTEDLGIAKENQQWIG